MENIIKKIFKSTKRNIIIHDEKYNNVEIFNKYMHTSLNIYKVYAGHVYNPPYFDLIYIIKSNYSEDDCKMLWNMLTMNGILILYNSKQYNLINVYYKNYVVKSFKNTYMIKKISNICYSFPKYRIIDFIIGGTMKGGTTAAIINMNKHPDINVIDKEIHYYDKKEIYQKGVEWYKSHFDYSKKRVGDKAPDVMYQTSCLELLQITNPSVKIILFLRNPIDRAYSHWKMTKEKFRNNLSFEESIENELKYRMGENRTYDVSFWYHFIQRGFYYQQIMEILKYFSIDNLLILISEEVRKNMDKEYQKVFQFLNLPPHHDNYIEEFISNHPNDILHSNTKLYKKLKNIYSNDVQKLEKLLGYKIKWW